MNPDTLIIKRHPVLSPRMVKNKRVTLHVNGKAIKANEGEVLSALLWSRGLLKLGHHHADCAPRGVYCGIGHCYECRVNVDGFEDVRACLTLVKDGMAVILSSEHAHKKNDNDLQSR